MYYGMNPYSAQMAEAGQPELLTLLIEAMKDERHDRAKYKIMMDMTKDDRIKNQIKFAYDDEGKHYKMFQNIFYCLTGRVMDVPVPPVEQYNKLLDAVKTSIDGELEAVEMYRKIKALLPNKTLRDMLYEIITDEQEHATRFTYVYSLMTGKED